MIKAIIYWGWEVERAFMKEERADLMLVQGTKGGARNKDADRAMDIRRKRLKKPRSCPGSGMPVCCSGCCHGSRGEMMRERWKMKDNLVRKLGNQHGSCNRGYWA
jgi:hypothetical protein